jgi:hypothetical protein
MNRLRAALRTAASAAAAFALVIIAMAMLASPASARPHDCDLKVELFRNGATDRLIGRGIVKCANPEQYIVQVYIRRHDLVSRTPVGSGREDERSKVGGATIAIAEEPCSDVETDKEYTAQAYLYDTRFYYPIEIKDEETAEMTGPC